MVRAGLLARRRIRTPQEREAAARDIADRALAWGPLAQARCVAAYVSMGSEPGTAPLLAALVARGIRVLVPVLQPDNDLSWAAYEGPQTLTRTSRGLEEPRGADLGRDAIGQAQVVLVPGLAVDGRGVRLGRGGGSYDRALARVGADACVAVLLYDDEVLDQVPSEPHDRRVTHALTARGVALLRDPDQAG